MTQSIPQIVGNEINSVFGLRPLFSNGVQIGNYNVDYQFDGTPQSTYAELCSGSVTLFDNVTGSGLDQSTWQVQDPLTLAFIPAAQFCMSQGIVPPWIGTRDIAQYQANPDGTYSLPSSNNWLPVGIGLGIVALALLFASRK